MYYSVSCLVAKLHAGHEIRKLILAADNLDGKSQEIDFHLVNRELPNPLPFPLSPPKSSIYPPLTSLISSRRYTNPFRSTLLLLRLLQHLLHNLLFLDQKRAHDPVLNTVRAPRAAVGALHGFPGLGDGGVFAGPEGGDLFLER